MIRIQLLNEEIKLLSGLRKQTNDERSERALMILLSNDGFSVLQISIQLKRNAHTVRLWLNRYKEEGITGLKRKYSQGAPSTKRDLLIESFDEWFSKSPIDFGYQSNAWTIFLMIDLFKKKTQEIVSVDTVQRALKKSGYSYKKPKKTVPLKAPCKEAKKHRVLEMLTEIKAFIESDEANIYFLDETHFSTQPYIVKGWQKKGRPFLIPTPSKRESCTIFGAWNLKEEKLIWKSAKKGNKDSFISFLHQIKSHDNGKKTVIILDNASYHKSKKVKKWVKKYSSILLINLPTYSPEYNPIEQVWKWLKERVHGIKPITNGIKEILQRIRKICWHWRNGKLIKPFKIGIGIWNIIL